MTAAREAWDRELDERASPSPLLQTWGWGEVQSSAGWTVERVRLTGGAMASVQLRGLGPLREAYVPRGPVPASPEAVAALVDWARSAKVARIVVEPEAPLEFGEVMRARGFSLAASVQPQHMANDLAWWAAIKAAANDGCRDYDLWGVPPPDAGPEHPWHGLGFFKAEFGGEEVTYAGAWELVLSEAGSRLIDLEKKARGRIRGLKRNIS